jgi:hypothetical protein
MLDHSLMHRVRLCSRQVGRVEAKELVAKRIVMGARG